MKQELEKLYSHIDDIEIAMMTTRRADGHLQSRAMATQKRAEGADLWFVTLEGAQKLRDLTADPHEQHNLAADRQHSERLATMRARLTAWMTDQNDQRTVFNTPLLLGQEATPIGPAAGAKKKAAQASK